LHTHYSHNLRKGDDYSALNKTISIWLIDGTLTKKDTAYSKHVLLDEETYEKVFSEIEIVILEYNKKLPKEFENNQYIKGWLKFFRIETEEQLREVAKMSEIMQSATHKLQKFSVINGNRIALMKSEMLDVWNKMNTFIEVQKAEAETRKAKAETEKVRAEGEARVKREVEARKRELAETTYRICKLRGLNPHLTMGKDAFVDLAMLAQVEVLKNLGDFAEELAISFEEVLVKLKNNCNLKNCEILKRG